MEFSVINTDLYFRRKLAYYNISMGKKNDLKNYYTSNETETDKRKKCDYKKYLYYAQDITKFLYKNTPDTKDVVDEILLRYKAERFYNFSLNRAMLKSSVRLEKDGFPIHDESTKKCLLSFFLLPNVFSRNFFFQFAIDSRKNDHLELSNFYSRKDTSSVVSVFDDQGPKIDPIRTWQDLCLKFNYFWC